VFLLIAAAFLAVARWTGRGDLPRGALEAAGLLALLAVAARVARGVPGSTDAALHLDRALGTAERFTTVLETAESDPALAEWAARGALARAEGEGLARALAVRPPAALLPLLLAATLVAGLALLPGAPAAAGPVPAAGGASTAAGAAGSGAAGPGAGTAAPAAGAAAIPAPGAGTAAVPPPEDPVPQDPGSALRALEEKARTAKNGAALRDLAAAREALDRGDRAAAAEEVRRAMEALGAGAAATASASVGTVPGAGGDGAAARGDGTPAPKEPAFRPLPVPIRAREAVRKYFGSGN
jgi:hypothetical protein